MRSLFERISGARSRIISDRLIDTFFFRHTCDLWKPNALTFKHPGTSKAAADPVYSLASRGQKCLFVATPETDVPTLAARSKEVNIFTLDKFLFPVGVIVLDTWIIKLTSPNVDDNGRFWIVQGN